MILKWGSNWFGQNLRTQMFGLARVPTCSYLTLLRAFLALFLVFLSVIWKMSPPPPTTPQKGFVRNMVLRIERNKLEAAAAIPVRPFSSSHEKEMESLEMEMRNLVKCKINQNFLPVHQINLPWQINLPRYSILKKIGVSKRNSAPE